MTTPLAGTSTENKLRPKTLDEVVGQREVVEALRTALAGAQARGELPGHILFMGPPGTGKTTLALIVSGMVGAPKMVSLIGPNVRSPVRDLLRPLVLAKPRTVFFIDEIHRMYRPAQEFLFPVMEDGVIPDGSLIRLPALLFIGATTDPERLLSPMLDRFVLPLMLKPYSAEDLATIATRAAGKLGCVLMPEAAATIGENAEGTPRVALRLLRAARDYAYAAIVEDVRKASMMPDGVVTGHPDNPPIIIGPAAVSKVLASTAYSWNEQGRSASDR